MVKENKLLPGSIVNINIFPSRENGKKYMQSAVIVSNFILSETSPFIWVVPISQSIVSKGDYPLHVQLDERTKTNGTICVEQLKLFNFDKNILRFVEMIPTDLLDEVRKKVQLVVN